MKRRRSVKHQQQPTKKVKRDIVEACIDHLPFESLHHILQYIYHETVTINPCTSKDKLISDCSQIIQGLYGRFKHDNYRRIFLLPSVTLHVPADPARPFRSMLLCVPKGIGNVQIECVSKDNSLQKYYELAVILENVPDISIKIEEASWMLYSIMTLLTILTNPSVPKSFTDKITSLEVKDLTEGDYKVMADLKNLKTITHKADLEKYYIKYFHNITSLNTQCKNPKVLTQIFSLPNIKKLKIDYRTNHPYRVVTKIEDGDVKIPETSQLEDLNFCGRVDNLLFKRLVNGLKFDGLKTLEFTMIDTAKEIFTQIDLIPKMSKLTISNPECTLDAICGDHLAKANIITLVIIDAKTQKNFYTSLAKTTTIKYIRLEVFNCVQLEQLLSQNHSFEEVEIGCTFVVQMDSFKKRLEKLLSSCKHIKWLELHDTKSTRYGSSNNSWTSQSYYIGNCSIKIVASSII
jgi:hypothetical protein